jgi:hypothetical protein
MIDFAIDEAPVLDYLEATRTRILAGIRTGMQEAMEGLAWNVADKLQGSPIVSRSGALLGAILGSPHVTETAEVIRGTVSSDVGEKHIGLWLEEGTHVKAVEGKLFQFTAADGQSVFTHGHRAFQVKAHPFLNPSLEEYKPTIMNIIAQKIGEAVNATV